MNQKINGYILLTTFFLLFPSKSIIIPIPLKIYNNTNSCHYSFKENNLYSSTYLHLSHKMKNNSLHSYLKQIENNLFAHEVKIGSDSQVFNVILDTGSSIIWIPGIGSEDKEGQIIHHYNPETSITSKKCDCSYKVRYGSGYSLGIYYYDQINLFNDTNNNYSFYMKFGVANLTKFNVPGADGVFGLGRQSSLIKYSPLYSLKSNNFIDKAGFSIKYNSKLQNAILYYGDEHEDFKNTSVGFCPLSSNENKEKNFWSCKLFSFGIAFKEINTSIILNLNVIFDTGTNAIVLPKYILSFFKNKLKKIDCSINDLSLEISNIICFNKTILPDIVFEIENYYLTLSKDFLFNEHILKNKTVIYQSKIFFEEGIEMGIIGLPFFYEFHTRFDLDNNIMKFYHHNQNNIIKSLKNNKTTENDINHVLKILIIILSFIVLILIIFIVIKYIYPKIKKANLVENIIIGSSEKSDILPNSLYLLDK